MARTIVFLVRYMKRYFLLLLFFFITIAQNIVRSQPRDICEVFGTAFEEKNVFAATYRVFLEEDEYAADLVVFKETNELMADHSGLWFFTKNRAFAQFTICFVEDRNLADFSIYFTEIDAEARCNR